MARRSLRVSSCLSDLGGPQLASGLYVKIELVELTDEFRGTVMCNGLAV